MWLLYKVTMKTNKTNPPKISVVIPTRHRNDLLALCLDRLAPGIQSLPTEEYEVIVTDDGSTSTAQQLVQDKYPWARWTAGPRRGPAANRNHGAALAKGEWLAFTDDDCLPDTQWLSKLSEAMDGPALALEGAIHPLGDTTQDLAECPVNLTGGYFWSANIAVKRLLFEKIGGFDVAYPLAAHEDVDMKLRLAAFTEIRFVQNAIIRHPVRFIPILKAIHAIPKQCRAFAIHVKKHRKALGYGNNVSFMVHSYRFYIVRLLRSLRSRKFKTACVALSYLTFGLPCMALILAAKN